MVRHWQSCGCLNAMSWGMRISKGSCVVTCCPLTVPPHHCAFSFTLRERLTCPFQFLLLNFTKDIFLKEYLKPFHEPFVSYPILFYFFLFISPNFCLLLLGGGEAHKPWCLWKPEDLRHRLSLPLGRWNLDFQQVPSSSVPPLQSLPGGYLAFFSPLICLFLFCAVSLYALCLYFGHLLLTFFGVNFICCKARKWEPCMGQLGI